MAIKVGEREFVLPEDWQAALNDMGVREKDLLLLSFCIQTGMTSKTLMEADSLSIKTHLYNMMMKTGMVPAYSDEK